MQTAIPLTRDGIFPERSLSAGHSLLQEGRAMAQHWSVGNSAFHKASGCLSEAAYKRRMIAEGQVMQHAHLGFRDLAHSIEATAAVYEACAAPGSTGSACAWTGRWAIRGSSAAGRRGAPAFC